jgi:hypothetical protein
MSGATIVTLGTSPHLDPMARPQPARLVALALLASAGLFTGPAVAQGVDLSSPGAKGARVYCSMRGSGNSHEVSWTAAYALIKRQSASLFKTSPEHAAVMITEAVVNNPGSFPDCGKYLGDLYTTTVNRQKQAAEGSGPATTTAAANASTASSSASTNSPAPAAGPRDRYTY